MTAPVPLIAALRTATAATHQAVEDLPDMARLTSAAVTVADYRRYLPRIARVYATLEPPLYAALAVALSPVRVAALGLRPKSPALRADLAANGLVPLDGEVPAGPAGLGTVDIDLAIGGLYVLEGATLGGRVIARHLRRRLGQQLVGTSFFEFHGEDASAAWKRLGGELEALAVAGLISPQRVIAGARAVFQQVFRMLAATEGPPTPPGPGPQAN